MMYFIHNIFCSQYMIYFINNILCISFTILWIKFVIHAVVHLLLFIYFEPRTVLVFAATSLTVPQLLVYTWKQTDIRENLIDAVFQIFLSNSPWDEVADFLTRASVACGFRIHFVHDSTAADCPKLDRQTLARLILFLHPHYMLQSNLHSYY